MEIGILSESEMTSRYRRATKFTPERFEQIRNLVERGRSREEIADMIGCTLGTLAVTCSKNGISLRAPRIRDTGIDAIMRKAADKTNGHDHGKNGPAPTSPMSPVPPAEEEPSLPELAPPEPAVAPEPPPVEKPRMPVTFALRIEYRGVVRDTPISLDDKTLATLALEAMIRDMRLGDLIAKILTKAIEKGMYL